MKRILKFYMEKPELVALLVLALLVIVFTVRTDGLFMSRMNVMGIMSLFPEMAIMALGFSFLMIAGEFDLSVGSMFGFMPMVAVGAMEWGISFWPAFALGCLAAIAIGLVNAGVTLRFEIPSFITTLGMLFVLRSLTVVIYASGTAPTLPDVVPSWAFSDFIGSVRVSAIWLVVLSLIAWALMEKTNFGSWVRATGGEAESSAAMGIPTKLVKTLSFCLCSLFAGVAGMIQVVRLGSPLPSLGDGLELQAIAASVIGGVALYGGVGNVIGAVIGMAIIRVIDAGMIMSRVDASWFKFAIGVLTIAAVVANAWLGRRAKKIKVEVGA